MQLHSFQDTALKLLIHVKDFQEQIVKGLTIPRYPRGLGNKGLITKKTWIQHAFAQFSRYEVSTSQVRQILPGTGCEKVGDSTVLPEGSGIKS